MPYSKRLGFGPFNFWRQMTGGAHGVFALLPVCDSISMYGFTSWIRSTDTQKDQYAGNAVKGRASVGRCSLTPG